MDYVPRPIDTSEVELDKYMLKLCEVLIRNAHEVWAQHRIAEGWRHGPERSDQAREHPSIVPYDQLPEDEKAYDRSMVVETIKALLTLGYRIEAP